MVSIWYVGICMAGILLFTAPSMLLAQDKTGRCISMDDQWRFHRGGAQDAEHTGYNDLAWRLVDLPHDWSIEDLPGTHSPFDSNAVSQVSGGFTVGGTGWYRKHFKIPSWQKGKHLIIQMDGVYMNTEVWLNGKSVSKYPYGYTSFWFDITDRLKYDGDNVLVVKVRNEGENSRWYSGSGVYRHVWLKVWEPLHITQWGLSATTLSIDNHSARLNIQTKVMNETAVSHPVRLKTHILNSKGKEIAVTESVETIIPGVTYSFNQNVILSHPELWSVDVPVLNTIVSEIFTDGKLTDSDRTTIGIRTISFDATKGFCLNGKTLKLKGGCIHHDNGPLGAKAYDRAEERKIQLLKAAGYNAVRCAHNPPSPVLLDACDRLGMLVIDEAFDCWEGGKNQLDYHIWFKDWWQRDLESLVLRDYNHPSVIMWSIGNEIPNREKPEVVAVAKRLSGYVRQLDSTRPVTCGVNGVEENKDPGCCRV
jgi:beta-galactosidase